MKKVAKIKNCSETCFIEKKKKKLKKSTFSGININVSYLLQKKNKTETGSTSMDVLFIIKPTAIKSWHDQVDFWNIQQL